MNWNPYIWFMLYCFTDFRTRRWFFEALKNPGCLYCKLCKTLWAPIELSLCRQEGYSCNFIGRSEVLFHWAGRPRHLCCQTGFAELCCGIRQHGAHRGNWERFFSFFWTNQISRAATPPVYAWQCYKEPLDPPPPALLGGTLFRSIVCPSDACPAVELNLVSTYCWNTIDKEDVTCWGHHTAVLPLIQSSWLVTRLDGHVTG